MDSALGWIGKIFEYLGMFVPRPFILTTKQRAIRWKRGKNIKEDGPGMHVFWPFTTVVQKVTVVRQAVQLKPLLLTTKDLKSLVVDVVIVFEIFDSKKALVETDEIIDTIGEVALTAIPESILGYDLEEIISDAHHDDPETLSPLNNRITEYTRKILEDFGVRTLYCKIGNISPVVALRLVGDGGSVAGSFNPS